MIPFPVTSFVLWVDGAERTAHLRDPGTGAADAVIWLHGAGGEGREFLEEKVDPRVDVIDVAPTALSGPSGTIWVIPGTSPALDPTRWPPLALDAHTDLRLLDALVEHLLAETSAVRVWVAGFSAGGKLAWSAYALNDDDQDGEPGYAHEVSGYAFVASGEPVTFDWTATSPVLRPAALWHSTDDDPSAISKSWEDSIADLAARNGCDGFTPFVPPVCGGPLKTVEERLGTGCTTPVAHWEWTNGGHAWAYPCPVVGTDDQIVLFWRGSGFGT